MLKTRKAKNSTRGIYIQDKELLQTNFQPSRPFVYEIDTKGRSITIRPSERTEETKNRVSKRCMRDYVKPVIDIRDKSVLSVLEGAKHLEIIIEKNRIRVVGKFNEHTTILDTTSEDLQSAVAETKYTSYFQRALKVADPILRNIGLSDTAKNGLKLSFDIISLFSGAGIMDEGFVQEGFQVKFALENNSEAVMSYRLNHTNDIACVDITKFDKSAFNEIGSTVMIGGSPCQGFSNSNRHTNFLDNPNNLLVREYIDSIKNNPNCKVFVLENVPRLLTAGNGMFKQEIFDELSDFDITSGVLCAADYGTAQLRKRAFIIGSKIGQIELPSPTHNEDSYTTVKQALNGLNDKVRNQLDYTIPKPGTIERMSHISPGSNWRELPVELMSNGMKEGKTHSNVFRRLLWDKPSIALPNFRKSNILHPSENRSISVRECARLFGISDDYLFTGSLSSIQQMVCNAIPIEMSRAIAKAVKGAIKKFNNSLLQPQLTY
ncbi:DNA cytosine methyltransferase (plasmid) [Sporosarcina psychrophila]|uniref:DNA cytosine methyltransferase n=1 Tax=Sporosarcina psychrophila TaxID=1476 RepID=UPI0030D367CB